MSPTRYLIDSWELERVLGAVAMLWELLLLKILASLLHSIWTDIFLHLNDELGPTYPEFAPKDLILSKNLQNICIIHSC